MLGLIVWCIILILIMIALVPFKVLCFIALYYFVVYALLGKISFKKRR